MDRMNKIKPEHRPSDKTQEFTGFILKILSILLKRFFLCAFCG